MSTTETKGTGPDRDSTLCTPRPWECWQDPINNMWRIIHKSPDNTIIIGFIADEGDAKQICYEVERLDALEAELATARNDALEKAANLAAERMAYATADAIRTLKDNP